MPPHQSPPPPPHPPHPLLPPESPELLLSELELELELLSLLVLEGGWR